MTRPKKEEMYRNHRITVRFTETEFSIIKLPPNKLICHWLLMYEHKF